MKNLTRRDFLGSAGLVLAAALPAFPQPEQSEKQPPKAAEWPGFKYAMCNESMAGKTWPQQCRIVADAGYKGIEIAAFTLVNEGVHEKTPAQRREMLTVMKDAGIECAGLHWLLAPPPKGLHFTTADKSVRQKTIAYLDDLIDFCADLGGTVMIFGSPKQRSALGTSVEQAGKYFAEGLTKVADHASRRSVKILVEPLDTSQTDVVNTMAGAMQTVKTVDHPAVELMFDFHNTPDETEPFDLLIRKFHKHIFHVHVQEMDGRHLGTGFAVNDYVRAFQALKDMKYDKWVSLEVFDFSPGGKTIAQESIKTLRQIENKLI